MIEVFNKELSHLHIILSFLPPKIPKLCTGHSLLILVQESVQGFPIWTTIPKPTQPHNSKSNWMTTVCSLSTQVSISPTFKYQKQSPVYIPVVDLVDIISISPNLPQVGNFHTFSITKWGFRPLVLLKIVRLGSGVKNNQWI